MFVFLKKENIFFAQVSLVFYSSQLDQCVSQHDVKQYCCGRGSVQSKLGENSIVATREVLWYCGTERKQYCGIVDQSREGINMAVQVEIAII